MSIRTQRTSWPAISFVTLALAALPALAAQMTDFTQLSIDELLQMKIVSVSKKPETIFDSAAAVFVITGDDVNRAGVTSLSSALRLAPGLHVARISASNTAVSARGFNDISANKLLVLMDGRSIYAPLFSGVLWSDQDYVLEDLQRIEVIRGPGATLWGSNAVNGVINISSKRATDTIGSLVSVTGGDWFEHSITIREGWRIGNQTSARLYAKTLDQDPAFDAAGNPDGGAQRNDLLGFRLDRSFDNGAELTLQSDWRRNRTHGETTIFSLVPPYASSVPELSERLNYYLLSRFTRPIADDGEFSLQAYYDYTKRDRPTLGETRHLFDIDAQIRRRVSPRHDIVAGVEARIDRDRLRSSSAYIFAPEQLTSRLFSGFIQDEITLEPDRTTFTVGAKLEDGETFDLEFQPNARLLFRPARDHAMWASVARAARTPSRAERTTRLLFQVIPPNPQSPLPTQIVLDTDRDFDSERLTASEFGYRWSFSPRLSFDAAAFRNGYAGLRSVEPRGTQVVFTPVPHVQFLSQSGNGLAGHTYGGEIVTNCQAADNWRLQASLTVLRYELELAQGGQDQQSLSAIPGSSPRTQFSLRSQWDITSSISCDVLLQHTAKLTVAPVPAYTALDIRLAWSPDPAWEFSLVGQDLLEERHPEFPPTFLGGDLLEIPRSCYARVTVRF